MGGGGPEAGKARGGCPSGSPKFGGAIGGGWAARGSMEACRGGWSQA